MIFKDVQVVPGFWLLQQKLLDLEIHSTHSIHQNPGLLLVRELWTKIEKNIVMYSEKIKTEDHIYTISLTSNKYGEPSWPWSCGSWIYNYPCNQCLSTLMWVRISTRARCDKVCQWHDTGRWFSPGSPVSSTNTTDRNDITVVLLNVALNTIKQTNKQNYQILTTFNIFI